MQGVNGKKLQLFGPQLSSLLALGDEIAFKRGPERLTQNSQALLHLRISADQNHLADGDAGQATQ